MAFRSKFSNELEEYLFMRKADFGSHTYQYAKSILTDFDDYLDINGANKDGISEQLVSGWIKALLTKNVKRTVRDKVSRLHGFLEYLQFKGFQVYMPPCPKKLDDYIPYLFSDSEMDSIFLEADNLIINRKYSSNQYIQWEFPMLLRILYGCGLRLGEAVSLKMSDVNFEKGYFWLKETKGMKQRFVPMTPSLSQILRKYCLAMNLHEHTNAFLFPAREPDRHLPKATVQYIFRTIIKKMDIPSEKASRYERGPCLHCVRHLFAIKSFKQAELNGRTMNDSIPFLSIYLGHDDLVGTEKYLKFSSDMFPEFTELFEEYAAGVFAEVDI